jgi:hypothetical protein
VRGVKDFQSTCVCQNGKLRLLDEAGYRDFVRTLGEGEEVVVRFEEVGRKRTSPQNRFFHGPICKAFLAADLGYRTTQEVKDMLALLFLPQEIKLPDGSWVRVPGHTSALSVREFNAFIEQCIQLAAENDIYIKDADEWRREHAA